MNESELIAKLAQGQPTGPSPYRADLLREQVVTTPILGVVVHRCFVGV